MRKKKVIKNILSLKNPVTTQTEVEIALAVGIDTTGGTSLNAKRIKEIKTVSSDKLEAFRSALKQCNENSKSIIIDIFSGVTKQTKIRGENISLNEIRLSQIERLNFLAQTEDEKNVVIDAAKQICDAESDESARKIADKYLKKLSAPKLTNMVDVIAILLKGGHISRFTPDFTNPKEVFYLVFIPIPDPPNKKTRVGDITQKQFNELCNKGIITERKHQQHTDSRGRNYAFYQLAEDIILRFRGKFNE